MSTTEKQETYKVATAEEVRSSDIIYAVPLYIFRDRNQYKAWVALLDTSVKFPSNTVRDSRYGEVTLSVDANSFTKPAIEDYWRSLIAITNSDPQSKTLRGASGHITYIEPFSMVEKPSKDTTAVLPGSNKAVKMPDIMNYLIDRHETLRANAPSQWRSKLLRSYPRSGWRSDMYNENQTTDYGLRVREEAANSWAELKASMSSTANLGSAYKEAKTGLQEFGAMRIEGDKVLEVNPRTGKPYSKKNGVFLTANWKGENYPKLNTDRIKYAGKRFNRLLNNTPSTLIKPITTWVRSVGDLEVHSIATLLSIYKVLNIFK